MNSLERLLLRLTDAYSKDPDSNLGKTLALAAEQIDDLRQSVEKARQWRDIDEAEGETLDNIGYNVQQWRGQADDSVYRILIKSKVARNLSDGSVNTIIDILAITLDTDKQNVTVDPTWDEEPASVYIEVPAERLNEVGLSLSQFGRLSNRMVAAGVKANVLFEGTFQFSSDYDSVNSDDGKGFNELVNGEPGDIGGYFGAYYDPAEDEELPL